MLFACSSLWFPFVTNAVLLRLSFTVGIAASLTFLRASQSIDVLAREHGLTLTGVSVDCVIVVHS